MKKKKKITIKFFLNKHLQPRYVYKEGVRKPVLAYPLYIQIIYNRGNTQFKSFYGDYYTDLTKVDEENLSGPGLLEFEENIVRKIMEFEIEKQGENVDLKEITRKYEKYAFGVQELLNRYLKSKLQRILRKTRPFEYVAVFNYEDPKVDFLILYKAANSLYDNLDKSIPDSFAEEIQVYEAFSDAYAERVFSYFLSYPVIIDWLKGSLKKDFEEKLSVLYKTDREKVTNSLKIIDNIVRAKTEA